MAELLPGLEPSAPARRSSRDPLSSPIRKKERWLTPKAS